MISFGDLDLISKVTAGDKTENSELEDISFLWKHRY